MSHYEHNTNKWEYRKSQPINKNMKSLREILKLQNTISEIKTQCTGSATEKNNRKIINLQAE